MSFIKSFFSSDRLFWVVKFWCTEDKYTVTIALKYSLTYIEIIFFSFFNCFCLCLNDLLLKFQVNQYLWKNAIHVSGDFQGGKNLS